MLPSAAKSDTEQIGLLRSATKKLDTSNIILDWTLEKSE